MNGWKKYVAPTVVATIIFALSGWIGKSICKTIDKNEGKIERLYEVKAEQQDFEKLVGDFKIYKLTQYRKYLQERIWQIQRDQPNTYLSNPEYQRLITELRNVDLKINAYYRGGK